MRGFRDVSLRGKLLVSFGAVLLVTAVLGGVAILEMGSIRSAASVIANNAVPSIRTINKVNADEQAYRRDQLMNMISTSAATNKAIAADMSTIRAAVNAQLAGYKTLVSNGEDHTLWQKAQSQWAGYLTASAPLDRMSALQCGTTT